jgi:D-aminoacyl-tRNA deacylase
MGNPAITLSLSDPAGQTMHGILLNRGFKETEEHSVLRRNDTYLFVIEPLIVPEERYKVPAEPKPYPADYDSLSQRYDIDYIVVASRHWAQSGKPSLTVHPTGNFGKAMYGGRNRELQLTAPNKMRDVYLRILDDPPRGFEVSLEATHHSPTEFNVPMFFAEVGSRETQWRDAHVCEYLVDAILGGIEDDGHADVVIGFGGGHYCPTFSSRMDDYAFGHMAAKYAVPLLGEEMVAQMVEKSSGGADGALLDKGLKGHEKKKVEVILKKLGVPQL